MEYNERKLELKHRVKHKAFLDSNREKRRHLRTGRYKWIPRPMVLGFNFKEIL